MSCKSGPFLPLSDYVREKPLVTEVDGNTAFFTDGTKEKIDAVLYCTGYKYSVPFLSNKRGVNVTDKHIHPLYKQIIISIEHPTLAFIGLPLITSYFPLFDIQVRIKNFLRFLHIFSQVRFFLSTLNGHYTLPAKKEMLQNLNHAVAKPVREYHVLDHATGDYFEELATEANIKRISPVIAKLYTYLSTNRIISGRFRIIDDENWENL